VSSDRFDLVRAWFAAFNRSDADAAAAFYAPDAVFDTDAGVLQGRAAIARALADHCASWAPALDGGARRRVRTMGCIETGIATEWVGREIERASGQVLEAAGYDHFTILDGCIVRQRQVVRPQEAVSTAIMGQRPSRRLYPERPVVGVGAVIVQEGGVVLIKRRFEPLAGQWSLPGGTLELGETLEAGVAREIREETGLEVEVGPVIEVFDRILLDPDQRVRYHFVLIDYLCRPTGGTLVAGSDVAEAVLASPGELPRFRMTPKAVSVAERGLRMAADAFAPPR
jgi:ADP-ribose pyrophosphatase YjhB (NUDIX family)